MIEVKSEEATKSTDPCAAIQPRLCQVPSPARRADGSPTLFRSTHQSAFGVRRSSGPSGRRFLLDHSLRTAVPVERIQVPTKLRHFRRREKGTHIAFGSACGCFTFLLSFSVCLLLCLVPLVSLLISVRSSWKPVRSALDRDHSSSREVSIFFPFRSDSILVFFCTPF